MALSLPGTPLTFVGSTLAYMLGIAKLDYDEPLKEIWLRVHIYTATFAILLI
jgi:hypothetical protein